MVEEEVNKFNTNFKNFIEDVDEILESKGGGDGMKTVMGLLRIEDTSNLFIGNHERKIEWFCKILEREFDISPTYKTTLLNLYHCKSYNFFFKLMFDEVKEMAKIELADFSFDSLDEDDREIIKAYIDSFVTIAQNYKKMKGN